MIANFTSFQEITTNFQLLYENVARAGVEREVRAGEEVKDEEGEGVEGKDAVGGVEGAKGDVVGRADEGVKAADEEAREGEGRVVRDDVDEEEVDVSGSSPLAMPKSSLPALLPSPGNSPTVIYT